LLVAIAIFGLCAAAFIGALSTGSISTRLHGEQVVARNLAQSQIEKLKAASFDSSGASYSAISAPAGYSITVTPSQISGGDINIQKLTVTVSHNGNSVVSLEDYKVNR
jgi:type II secretory pathway pseudopilin PulG